MSSSASATCRDTSLPLWPTCNRRHDPDEIEEEQREVERRNKVNHEFQTFVKRVQENWERDYSSLDLEFDIPFR